MNSPLRFLWLAALATLAAGAGLAQSHSAASSPLQVPVEVDSPTGQLRCRAVITAGEGNAAISTGLEFVYPQRRTAEYLNVQLTSPTFDTAPDAVEPELQKAWFSTSGEDSHWTMPVTLGIAPVVLTLVAAPREPVSDRFVVSLCGSPAVPVICQPL